MFTLLRKIKAFFQKTPAPATEPSQEPFDLNTLEGVIAKNLHLGTLADQIREERKALNEKAAQLRAGVK